MNFYYSNCLFEAVKAKLKNPKIKIIFISSKINDVQNIHFMWTDFDSVYDFHVDANLPWYKTFLYKGYIRKESISSFNKWRRNRLKQVTEKKGDK